MVNRLFFDINVILDILTGRKPHYAASSRVYRMVEENRFTGLISILSLSTIHYILQTSCTHSEAVRLIKLLRDILEIVDAPVQTANLAMDSEWCDFEDALQYFAAVHGRADCIITRNPSDFRKSKLPIYTPEEFLEHIEWQSNH
jgi:predicted nucleic acid-binding protein